MTWKDVLMHYEKLSSNSVDKIEHMISLIKTIEKDATISCLIPSIVDKELIIRRLKNEDELSPYIKVIPFSNNRFAIGVYNTKDHDMRLNTISEYALVAIKESIDHV